MTAAILVIGATGTTGKELAKRLAKNGHKTRATVRPTSDKRELQALGVELVQADLSDVVSLVKAMGGIQKVYFATPLVPNMVELSSSIIRAAKSTGVKHLVKLSGGGAEIELDTMAKWHRAVEREIEQSGITHTFLRSNSFMQNFSNFSSHTIRDHGAFYAPHGDGKRHTLMPAILPMLLIGSWRKKFIRTRRITCRGQRHFLVPKLQIFFLRQPGK